jgi:hypothetical protein
VVLVIASAIITPMLLRGFFTPKLTPEQPLSDIG